ncbi:uncharacterized protein LOC108668453 isoform X2 [Hyalella azteca]|uniref:Uncharacterized protein LOC108668453 isoform X2 n=1 Tax=Hyalella azteca TaxID=294128 RepID=A0A8B7NC62_HYAAZ|nr:uncharacterized protein LOC108668453 isoform X2 [Hyalella azteca]
MGFPVKAYQLFLTAAALMCSTTAESRESCGLHTRLPTSSVQYKVAESCTSPCEVWSSYGTCMVDPTCFFKLTLALVQPADYEYVLDLINVQNPTDIEKRMKQVPAIVKHRASKEIDDLFEKLTEIYVSGTNYEAKIVQSEDQISSNSPAFNFDVPADGNNKTCSEPCVVLDKKKCRLNFLCYFMLEIKKLIQQNYPLSYLLDLSSLDDELLRFDHDAVLSELIETLKIVKIQLRTFLVFTYRTFNVMVDINNRNIDLISSYMKLRALSQTSNAESCTSNDYLSLIHRPQKLKCFEESLLFIEDTMQKPQLSFGPDGGGTGGGGIAGGGFGGGGFSSAGFGGGGGFINPGSNCPTDCQKRDRNNDCISDVQCFARKYNF